MHAPSAHPPVLHASIPDVTLAAALDHDGYALLPARLDAAQIAQLQGRFDDLVAAEGERAGREFQQEEGSRRLAHLVDKGRCFDAVWGDSAVLGCVAHILRRPFRLSSLNGREPLPGQGGQALHSDWEPRRADEPFHVVNSLWLLDPVYADNGATRLIPGSHHLAGTWEELGVNPSRSHPDEIALVAPAGSVLVYNAHLWHGGGINISGARRRMLHSYYVGCGQRQQYDLPALLSPATRNRLDRSQLTLLGIDNEWWTASTFPDRGQATS